MLVRWLLGLRRSQDLGLRMHDCLQVYACPSTSWPFGIQTTCNSVYSLKAWEVRHVIGVVAAVLAHALWLQYQNPASLTCSTALLPYDDSM